MLYKLIYLSFANSCQIKGNFVSLCFKGVKIDCFWYKKLGIIYQIRRSIGKSSFSLNICFTVQSEGQLNSELIHEVIVSPKIPTNQGTSINYVVSRGEGVKNCQFYLHSKKTTKRGEGSKIANFETTQFMDGPLQRFLPYPLINFQGRNL